MNELQRTAFHVAVLAALGVAGEANAVHVNPRHTGSVLVFPYYTVRAEGGGAGTSYYDNYLSIVNTTTSTKAVKVRFLESRRAAAVLSFNLFLSPFDVWTGGVVRTNNLDGQAAAKLVSTDRSCTVPRILFLSLPDNRANQFGNANYANSGDGGGATLDRTREGYLEVLEMGAFTNTTAIASASHNSAGIPANCAYFEANEGLLAGQLVPPTGGLHGAMSLINVRLRHRLYLRCDRAGPVVSWRRAVHGGRCIRAVPRPGRSLHRDEHPHGE